MTEGKMREKTKGRDGAAAERSDVTRRRFISTSLAGLAAAGLTGFSAGLARAEGETKPADPSQATGPVAASAPAVIYRDLGKTGMRLPIVSMGAMNADNPEVVRASYDLGVRHFDTASLYAFGRNEQMLGKVVKEMGVRDRVVIGTKERLIQRSSLSDAEAKATLVKITEGSLRRLQTDYVDILCWHSVENMSEIEDPAVWNAFAELKKSGKARATGVSVHQGMTEVINKVVAGGLCDVIVTSFNVSMADDAALLAALDAAAAAGIGIIAMKTQAGGRQLPNQAALADYDSAVLHTAMLKWVLRHPSVTTAIPGYASFEHMKQDLSVLTGIEYSEQEKKLLADNHLKLGLGFCRQCGTCLASCPRPADIPSLMRVHMYAAQYSNFAQARAVLDQVPRERGLAACRSCSACVARCPNSVDVAYRIGDLKMIYG
jgi:predicted aldo/keto reductase-like oxidoreductase